MPFSFAGRRVLARRSSREPFIFGSSRRQRRFVAVNCAAIPATLLESELLGFERGAFTGAVASRIGRFQAADKSTLFLDQIGELPLELQPKLLRAVQQQEIDRVGSSEPTRVDVRIIAATNQNLEQMLADGEFRLDVFYRLNVFPITIPPLRARREEIPLLIDHFVSEAARHYGRPTLFVPRDVVTAMVGYAWPGTSGNSRIL